MITKVDIEYFKKFDRQTFVLDETIVLAGPNNSGKSTLLQALSTWSMALQRWRIGKGGLSGTRESKAKVRTGQPVTRKDFTALPLREFNLLWYKTRTALRKHELEENEKLGQPRLIHISVDGSEGLTREQTWSLTMELRYQSSEMIYVRPVELSSSELPTQVENTQIVHCPPFSGIGAEERRMDRGAQELEIGRGKPGDILRNLLLEVHDSPYWDDLVENIQELFRVTLLEPEYDESLPFILCQYLGGIPASPRRKNGLATYDIASAGSGFHQVLLMLCLFYARPASVLLMDEPDAHLHVILQRQIYQRLRSVARDRKCQLIIATHSEVILDSTSPTRVVSFLGAPHRLVHKEQRDQVREAMGRLTTLDLLLGEQGRAVLYCESDSDFNILQAWARVLEHDAMRFFTNPFFHSIEGRDARLAKAHLFALRSIQPGVRGLLILDGDNRDIEDREIASDGLTIVRWKRYEIENYLIVPAAIKRFFTAGGEDLFSTSAADRAEAYLREQLPASFFANPLSDATEAIVAVAASKKLLPQMFEKADHSIEKSDYYLLATKMHPAEIHPDAIELLDQISELSPPTASDD